MFLLNLDAIDKPSAFRQITVPDILVRRRSWRSMARVSGATSLLFPVLVCAATAPSLGVVQPFAVIGATTVTNTGASVISGDLGVSPGIAITGFPPGVVTGTLNAPASAAQGTSTTIYNNLASQACTVTGVANLSGTLAPGVYCSATAMTLVGTVILDANNDPNAVFIFKAGTTLTTAASSQVLMINGGQSCNAFWQIGSSATLGTNAALRGSIFALTSATLTTGASINGRVVALNGAVTLDTNAVTACSLAPPAPPTLGKSFSPNNVGVNGLSTLTITLTNPNPAAAILTAPLIDNFPGGLVVASNPNAVTTCTGGGAPVAVAGSSSVLLPAGRSIAPNSSCTLTVSVSSASAGSYTNTLAAGDLVTDQGNNATPASALLTVGAVIASISSVPTLSEWAMIILTGLLTATGFMVLRRRR